MAIAGAAVDRRMEITFSPDQATSGCDELTSTAPTPGSRLQSGALPWPVVIHDQVASFSIESFVS